MKCEKLAFAFLFLAASFHSTLTLDPAETSRHTFRRHIAIEIGFWRQSTVTHLKRLLSRNFNSEVEVSRAFNPTKSRQFYSLVHHSGITDTSFGVKEK